MSPLRTLTSLAACWTLTAAVSPAHSAEQEERSARVRTEAVALLREALATGDAWVKVHAAEALLRLDYRQGVREAFERELAARGDTPQYRIGIWRVLARADSYDPRAWSNRLQPILAALLDEAGPDRLHAVETLGKLGYQLPPRDADDESSVQQRAAVEAFATTAAPQDQPFALWVLLNSAADETQRAAVEAQLAALLSSVEPLARARAAYVLRNQARVGPETRQALQRAADVEETESEQRIQMLTALAKHSHGRSPLTWEDLPAELAAELVDALQQGSPAEAYEVAQLLADCGTARDLEALATLLSETERDLDARVSLAEAVLRCGRRGRHGLQTLDWLVIAGYAFGMLAVGWFYSRRNRTGDDYLLGGRNMRPWAVGLSMFASLLSTLSYLSYPGEAIRYGPMILTSIAVYPAILVVVGWLLIPHIMRLRVTSAYEILERRFHVSLRMLGSLIFLVLRLLWMASIVFVTTSVVLVPLLEVDPSWNPWICSLLAVLTICYTSLGGLRAVVWTDVVQTVILFAGALAAVGIVTAHFGGFTEWFPREWQTHWQVPVWGLDTRVRMSFLGLLVAHFCWHVCTAGSDQIAIQRYLATRDAKTARSVLTVTLIADALVLSLMMLLGVALLAYFSQQPHLLADGQMLLSHSDQVFPRFIVTSLPVGVTGLVVAGLLAAAMSSLSSGVNSASSVITVDWVGRLRGKPLDERAEVRVARWASLLVGAAVVGLSLYVSLVPGNIVDICYKVVNLFVAPLFLLFFMALFVPWATSFGTWFGALVGIAVAVAVGYWEQFTGNPGISMLWIMPLSFLAGAVVGTIASLLPIGERRPPLARE